METVEQSVFDFAHNIDNKLLMIKAITIHLDEPNTLSKHLSSVDRDKISSLKITGLIGRDDFEDILEDLCYDYGYYDDDDVFISDSESTPLRHLDLGEATYVDGNELPYFGFHAPIESFILPKGINSTYEESEGVTGFSDTKMLKRLVLPQGLKMVGGFNSCPNLTGLVLPEGLEEISSRAFCGCTSITHIRIPSSVEVLWGDSFAGCNIQGFEVAENNPFLTAVDGVVFTKDLSTLVAFPSAYPEREFVVPETTKTIGEGAFMDSKIEHILLPKTINSIGREAFCGSSIRSIDIPDSVGRIEERALAYCENLTSIRLPNGLKRMSANMTVFCNSLKELEVPSSVKDVDYSNFIWSPSLERIILHDGLEKITGDTLHMRYGGKLKHIRLPKTLKTISGGIFNYSSCLDDISVDTDNPYFCIYGGALCSKDKKILYSALDYQQVNFIVPEGIEEIYDSAFAFLPKLQTVILPRTLKIIGPYAFHQCNSITQMHIPQKVIKVDMGSLWSDNLRTLIMDCEIPPEMTGHVDNEDWRYKKVNLLVPPTSVDKYKNASGWKSFNIKGYTSDE